MKCRLMTYIVVAIALLAVGCSSLFDPSSPYDLNLRGEYGFDPYGHYTLHLIWNPPPSSHIHDGTEHWVAYGRFNDGEPCMLFDSDWWASHDYWVPHLQEDQFNVYAVTAGWQGDDSLYCDTLRVWGK